MTDLFDKAYEDATAKQPKHTGPFVTRCASCNKELEFEKRPDTGHLTLCTRCSDPGDEASELVKFGNRYSSVRGLQEQRTKESIELAHELGEMVLEVYLKGYSQEAIAKQAGVTRSRIGKMIEAAKERRQDG